MEHKGFREIPEGLPEILEGRTPEGSMRMASKSELEPNLRHIAGSDPPSSVLMTT
jgi:hypothetical protein